jgi:hypothetical protein
MAKTDLFAALAAAVKAAGRTLREFTAAMRAVDEIIPLPIAARRRMTGRKAKAQLNPRQLWRRRRSRGRGTKGGARK